MNTTDYWAESISIAADECELKLTTEQLKCIAESVEAAHENYGMAFYSPPASDRISDIEREWKMKYSALQREFDRYRENSESAVKRALNMRQDDSIGIGEHGSVTHYAGRITQIL